VNALLKSCGFSFVRERPIEISGRLFFIDFHVNSIVINDERIRLNVALEVDGGYHNTPEQAKKDVAKDRALLSSVKIWRILRITDKAAMKLDAKSLYDILVPCQE
jgi:very-short-patch-repair endonuclease